MKAKAIKSSRIRRIQFVTLSFLVLAGIVNFLDRSSLSIAAPYVLSELRISDTQLGALMSAFSLAYGFAQLPIGPLLDRVGTRLILGAALSLWSLTQMATSFVGGFGTFLGLRVGLGLGEAPFMPAGVKAVNDWFAIENRGRAMSAVNMSSTVGLAIAPPLLTVVMSHFGWRRMFLIIGGIGLALAAAWYPLNRDRKHAGLTLEENAYLDGSHLPAGADANDGVAFRRWLGLFRRRNIWGMMLGFGGINYTAWLYLSWLPFYLFTERHLTLAHTGWLAAVPFLAGSLGMLANGLVADRLVGRAPESSRHSVPALMRSRKQLIIGGMICSAACTLCVTRATSLGGALALISLALFFIHFAGTSAWGLVQVASPAGLVATVGSIQNFGSFVCASIGPVLTGFLLDKTHSFNLVFAVCAGATLAGAMSYLLLVNGPLEETKAAIASA